MYGFPKYVPVAEKKAKAQAQLEKLKKKQPNLAPVTISGNKLAKTWWGVSWNKNLEAYADYANRIGRGRSYVRHGSVLDLVIEEGKVRALVHGSGRKPYEVTVQIKPIPAKNWQTITEKCGHSIDSLEELAAGKFPKELSSLFTLKGDGLFPTPKEIQLECSCPDWAVMCKHVAAALYGVGARLDEDPTLFFTLRSAPYEELLKEAVQNRLEMLLENADKHSARAIDDDQIHDLFGL